VRGLSSLAAGFFRFIELVRNWQALEPDARAATQARVGALTTHEHLPCLQELAQWVRYGSGSCARTGTN